MVYCFLFTKNQKEEQKLKNIDEKILMVEEETKQLQNKRDKRFYEKGAVFESIFNESKDFTKYEFY